MLSIAKKIYFEFNLNMRITPHTTTTISFKGYDARKLSGLLMNSNYCSIAEEMLEIAKKEELPLYLINKNKSGIRIDKNIVEQKSELKNCWAQDLWTIIKNKIECFEEYGETEAVKDFFNLGFDNIQQEKRKNTQITDLQNFLTFLVNLPKCKIKDEEFVYGINEITQEKKLIPRALIDKDIKDYTRILEKLRHNTHISGGNFYIVKTKNNTEELLIGENELKKFTVDQMKKMFCVEEVHPIPQADYHLDMYIRPLDNKRVLVADDKLTMSALKEGLDKIHKEIKNTQSAQDAVKYQKAFEHLEKIYKRLKNDVAFNPYSNTADVKNTLENAGFETISVPGRIYEIYKNLTPRRSNDYFLKQSHNYLNAIVFKNKNDELVYITNNSLFDKSVFITDEIEKKINFSMKRKFIESIKPYIKEEKIYFVSGKGDAIAKNLLPELQGGIHCMCTELPQRQALVQTKNRP